MRARNQAGFTLVEVVVAFVLLSVVLATAYQLFSAGLQRASDLELYSRALVVAQSQLDQASYGETFEEGQASGDSEDRVFHWTVTTSAYDQGVDPTNLAPRQTFYPVRVAVRVAWQSAAGNPRTLDLATLGLARVQ